MSSVDDALSRCVEQVLASGSLEAIPPESVQRLLSALVKVYVARRENGTEFWPILPDALTATEIMVTASAMLKAANLEVFELSMWNSWATGA